VNDYSEKSEDRSPGMYWLCHHGLIVEWVDDYERRVKYIREEKKPRERPRRLKWFRRVQGKLPAALVRAARIGRERVDVYVKARNESIDCLLGVGPKTDFAEYTRLTTREEELKKTARRADRRYTTLLKKHHREIMRLFRKECPGCPWNGERLVFPGEKP